MIPIRSLSPSNRAFLIFALSLIAGFALIWVPLGVLAASGVALLTSLALARSDRADEG